MQEELDEVGVYPDGDSLKESKMQKVKVVLNRCYGGFSLSQKAMRMLGIQGDWEIERDDPRLVQLVEELGQDVAGTFAHLVVGEALIHPDFDWTIFDYDGMERINYLPKEHLNV